MDKATIIALVQDNSDEAETFYVSNGPSKHEQEEHYELGVAVVGMNVRLFEEWLGERDGDAPEAYCGLPGADRRVIWEASGFHFGI